MLGKTKKNFFANRQTGVYLGTNTRMDTGREREGERERESEREREREGEKRTRGGTDVLDRPSVVMLCFMFV